MTNPLPDENNDERMDREAAILVLNACYRAAREMGELGVAIEGFAPGTDGREIKMQAGMVIAEIGRITDTIFQMHPDLEAYVESRIERFGRFS